MLHKNGRRDKVKTQVEKAVGTVCTRSQAGCEGGQQNLHREGELSNDHNIADGNREGGLSNDKNDKIAALAKLKRPLNQFPIVAILTPRIRDSSSYCSSSSSS